MIKKFFLLLTAFTLTCALCVPAAMAEDKVVRIATLDWEPYIGQKLDGNGFVAEIIREAFKRSGYELQLDFYPWARVVKLASEGKYDGYAPEYYSEEIKQHSVFSDPFKGGPLGFFKRKDEDINYSNLEDLKPYRIGVVRGYVNTAEFDAADYLEKDEAVDDLTNLRKLLKKRINLAVMDKYVGAYLLKQNMPDEAGDLVFLEPPLKVLDLYVCFSLKAPEYEAKLKAFNEGLKQIKDDGTFDAILKKHGF